MDRNAGASNSGLAVVAMLLGAFVLIAAACLTAVTLTGSSGSAPTAVPAVPEARQAAGAIQARLAGGGWRQRSVATVALGATEECAPIGWNAGATSRSHATFDHRSGARHDGEASVDLTVYRSAKDATADLDRARGKEWVDCQRREMQAESDGGTEAVLRALPDDPRVPGVTYSYRYREDHELEDGTIHVVVVGPMRADITCECTAGPEVARRVAAALADLQN